MLHVVSLQSNAALEDLLTVAEMKHDIPGLLRAPTFLDITSQRVADLRKGNSLLPTEANGRSQKKGARKDRVLTQRFETCSQNF